MPISRRGFGIVTAAVVMCCFALTFSRLAFADQKAKPIQAGDVLSGELTAMQSGSRKNPSTTYQLTSEPRRLPGASGLCNLEAGPETFEIVINSDAEVAVLEPYIGKSIALRVKEMSCAQTADQMSDAVVSKWSVVTKR